MSNRQSNANLSGTRDSNMNSTAGYNAGYENNADLEQFTDKKGNVHFKVKVKN